MRQFGDFSDEVIEEPSTFVDNLRISNTNAFVRYRGYKATWKSFDDGSSHFVKLVESSENINIAFVVFSNNMIDSVLADQRTSFLATSNFEMNSLTKLCGFIELRICILAILWMVEEKFGGNDTWSSISRRLRLVAFFYFFLIFLFLFLSLLNCRKHDTQPSQFYLFNHLLSLCPFLYTLFIRNLKLLLSLPLLIVAISVVLLLIN